jgi:hypothetical protein
MASGQERRKLARSEQTGNISHDAQQRVQKRVMEIMSRRAAAERRESPSDPASRRPVTSRS